MLAWSVKKPRAKNNLSNKFQVEGKLITLEEVKDLASRELSDEQKKINQQRVDESKALLELILTDECNVGEFFY